MESKRCVGINGTGQATILSVTVLHQTQNNKAKSNTLHSFFGSSALYLHVTVSGLSFEAKTHSEGELLYSYISAFLLFVIYIYIYIYTRIGLT